jgi:4'-phosphopantetheinyl transferase EntD
MDSTEGCLPSCDTGYSGAPKVQPSGQSDATTRFSPFSDARISCVCVTESQTHGFQLHPLEEEAVGEAVSPKRRTDFTLGRLAARRALENLGVSEVSPVLRGEHREPIFPKGIVGSISHSGGYGVAAVAWQHDFSAVGVDIQQIEDRYSDELIARFADPDEFDWVRSVSEKKTERAVKLFSAKESVFKALYPLARVWFAFDAAKLTPREDELGFAAAVRLPGVATGIISLHVEVAKIDGFVVTGCWMEG